MDETAATASRGPAAAATLATSWAMARPPQESPLRASELGAACSIENKIKGNYSTRLKHSKQEVIGAAFSTGKGARGGCSYEA